MLLFDEAVFPSHSLNIFPKAFIDLLTIKCALLRAFFHFRYNFFFTTFWYGMNAKNSYFQFHKRFKNIKIPEMVKMANLNKVLIDC